MHIIPGASIALVRLLQNIVILRIGADFLNMLNNVKVRAPAPNAERCATSSLYTFSAGAVKVLIYNEANDLYTSEQAQYTNTICGEANGKPVGSPGEPHGGLRACFLTRRRGRSFPRVRGAIATATKVHHLRHGWLHAHSLRLKLDVPDVLE